MRHTQRYALDTSSTPKNMPTLYLGQGDKNGTYVQAEIYSNGIARSFENGEVVRFSMRLPNSERYYSVDGVRSGNVATFLIDETYAAAVPGRTENAYVEIVKGDELIASTNRIEVVILPSATQGADPAQAWTNGIAEFLEDSEERLDGLVESTGEQTAAIVGAAVDELEARTDEALEGLADAVDTANASGVKLLGELPNTGSMMRITGGPGVYLVCLAGGPLGSTVDWNSVYLVSFSGDVTPTFTVLHGSEYNQKGAGNGEFFFSSPSGDYTGTQKVYYLTLGGEPNLVMT